MRLLIALIACGLALPAFGQNVTATWVNATRNTDNSVIAATGPGSLVRTVVEYGTRNGSAFGTKAGEVGVAAPATTLQLSLVVMQEFALRAFHCNTYATTVAAMANGCSGYSNVYFVVPPAPTPQPPGNLTVTSTRIEAAEWTCRDGSGAILSSHTRQDKAQESCTNHALAALGTNFEMRPSGYRIVAR